jgi:hypothetical protein
MVIIVKIFWVTLVYPSMFNKNSIAIVVPKNHFGLKAHLYSISRLLGKSFLGVIGKKNSPIEESCEVFFL